MGNNSASGGGVSNNSGWSLSPSLAIGPDGMPIVAWIDEGIGGNEIYVRRWNGSAWIEMGAGSATGSGGISNTNYAEIGPSLVIAANGTPILAWPDGSSSGGSNNDIYIRRYLPCYQLTLHHTGQGSTPNATSLNSPGCATGQYSAGQVITLNANPAAGWRVKNWIGTNDDASTSTTNTVTMPANAHTVSVTYELIPTAHRLYAPMVTDWPGSSCVAGPGEIEPNNSQSQANGPLCNGQNYLGLPQDSWDLFYLDAAQAGNVVVAVANHLGGGVQLQLYYQTVDGAPEAKDTVDDDGLHVELPGGLPGRYYIAVYVETPNTGTSTQYTLRATFAGQ
jgi:hypothetical protein